MASTTEQADEDYIDMEVMSSSSSSIQCCSSPQGREFEFQMSSSFISSGCRDSTTTTTSPADELFYKGKLLPLLLPPRLQMLHKLLHSSIPEAFEEEVEETIRRKCCSKSAPCTNSTTPLDSCNISPSESCRVSCELNPDDCFFEWTPEFSKFIDNHHQQQQPNKKSWSKKLRLIKDSSMIGQKIKASRAYLRSLFIKSACSDESSAKAAGRNNLESDSRGKCQKGTTFEHVKKGPYPTIANVMRSSIDKEDNSAESDHPISNSHRRSFSRALKRHAPVKCLSSSGSSSTSSSSSSSSSSSLLSLPLNNANGFYELQTLKRSSSDTTEMESSIQAAIAHCKKSQHDDPVDSRNISSKLSEAAGVMCSLSASKNIIALTIQDQDRPGLCKN